MEAEHPDPKTGVGLELVDVEPQIDGGHVTVPAGATLVSVVRGGVRLPPDDTSPDNLQTGDRLVVLRESRNGGD